MALLEIFDCWGSVKPLASTGGRMADTTIMIVVTRKFRTQKPLHLPTPTHVTEFEEKSCRGERGDSIAKRARVNGFQ